MINLIRIMSIEEIRCVYVLRERRVLIFDRVKYRNRVFQNRHYHDNDEENMLDNYVLIQNERR